jgi:hypothetical protein
VKQKEWDHRPFSKDNAPGLHKWLWRSFWFVSLPFWVIVLIGVLWLSVIPALRQEVHQEPEEIQSPVQECMQTHTREWCNEAFRRRYEQ